jgi:photosystem II stability/assembly factor-like uncharacterized protein
MQAFFLALRGSLVMSRVVPILSLLLLLSFDARSQWVQTNGPYGGDANSIVSNQNYAFAAAGERGLYRSTNSGQTWSLTKPGSLYEYYSRVYQTGSTTLVQKSYGFGSDMLVSTDNGASFNSVIDLHGNISSPLARIGSSLYAAATYGDVMPTELFFVYSSDDGRSWQNIVGTGQPFWGSFYCSLASCNEDLFLTIDTGIWRSNDGAKSWLKLPALKDSIGLGIFSIDSVLFVKTSNGSTLRSTNCGDVWTDITTKINGRRLFPSSQNNNTFYGLTDSGIYISTNQGVDWSLLGLKNEEIFSLTFSGANILAATSSGIYLSSDNGSSWGIVGLKNSNAEYLTVIDSTIFVSLYFNDRKGDIERSADKGVTWTSATRGKPIEEYLNYAPLMIEAIDSTLWCSASNVYFLMSSGNFGDTWNSVKQLEYKGDNAFTLLRHDNDLYLGTDEYRIYRSNLQGEHWTIIDSSFATSELNRNIYSIAVTGNTIFAASSNDGILRSTDNGHTWASLKKAIPDIAISSLAVLGQYVFAGTSPNGVYRTSDNGETWEISGRGYRQKTAMNVLLPYDRYLFAGSRDSGLFLSSDSGATWRDVGFPKSAINDLVVMNGDLYVATQGAGVWRRSISELLNSLSVESEQVVARILLVQAYPNPASESVTIAFSADEDNWGYVRIVDPLGKEVYTRKLKAGQHSLMWDTQQIASGVYLATVRDGDAIAHAQIVVNH